LLTFELMDLVFTPAGEHAGSKDEIKIKGVSSAARPSSFLLMSVKRNEAKKNALCQRQTRLFIDEGIFREGILPSRKTPHIHVRRPPGLPASNWHPHLQKPEPGQRQRRFRAPTLPRPAGPASH